MCVCGGGGREGVKGEGVVFSQPPGPLSLIDRLIEAEKKIAAESLQHFSQTRVQAMQEGRQW